MKFTISYAYDLPHYADFTIEARNEEEALQLAEKALREGRFKTVAGQPNDTVENERVFICETSRVKGECLETV